MNGFKDELMIVYQFKKEKIRKLNYQIKEKFKLYQKSLQD